MIRVKRNDQLRKVDVYRLKNAGWEAAAKQFPT